MTVPVRPRLAAGTVIAGNFTAYASLLVRSFRRWHPRVPFYVVLTDDPAPGFTWTSEECTILPIAALGPPRARGLCFHAGRRQLAIALKPYLLRYLMDQGYETGVFLDADLLIMGPLDPLFATASAHALTVTPHVLDPPPGPDRHHRELMVLRSGTYNGGCVAATNRDESRRFIEWWGERVAVEGYHDPDRGRHYDQRWLDFAPSFVDDFAVARHRGLNVAYWNQHERGLHYDGVTWRVDGETCRFFHFSGFDPRQRDRVTQYWPDMDLATVGGAAPLFGIYANGLASAGYESTVQWPYTFECFDNGVRIPDTVRELYREAGEAVAQRGDPFVTGPGSFFEWLTTVGPGNAGLPPLWQVIYDGRPDLQSAFPDPNGSDRDGFASWTRRAGIVEHGLDPAFGWTPSSAERATAPGDPDPLSARARQP